MAIFELEDRAPVMASSKQGATLWGAAVRSPMRAPLAPRPRPTRTPWRLAAKVPHGIGGMVIDAKSARRNEPLPAVLPPAQPRLRRQDAARSRRSNLKHPSET